MIITSDNPHYQRLELNHKILTSLSIIVIYQRRFQIIKDDFKKTFIIKGDFKIIGRSGRDPGKIFATFGRRLVIDTFQQFQINHFLTCLNSFCCRLF